MSMNEQRKNAAAEYIDAVVDCWTYNNLTVSSADIGNIRVYLAKRHGQAVDVMLYNRTTFSIRQLSPNEAAIIGG